MPCFYCGKPISFVRRLADPDFCSDDHREKYYELTRMALQRLVESRDRLEAAGPKRKRQRSAAAGDHATPPLPADFLPELTQPVPSAGQLRLWGEFAPPALPVKLPTVLAPVLRASCTAGDWAAVATPCPVQALEARSAVAEAQGGWLSMAPPGDTSWLRLGFSAASLPPPGLPAQPILAPSGLEAKGAGGGAPVSHGALPPFCVPRLPPAGYGPPARGWLSTPALVFALPGPAACPAPPATPAFRGQVEIPAAGMLLPSETAPRRQPGSFAPGLATVWKSLAAPLPAEAAELRPSGPAPTSFLAPAPRVGQAAAVRAAAGLAAGQAVLAGPVAPHAPAMPAATLRPALAEFAAPRPRMRSAPAPRGAAGLPLRSPMAGEPAPPVRRPFLTILESGSGMRSILPEIALHDSLVWRLQPVRFDFAALTVPPALSVWLPMGEPNSRPLAGKARAAPPEPWCEPAPGLVSIAMAASQLRLRSAPPVPVELPTGEFGPDPRMTRPAPSPEFPITRQFYIGWGARSLRRALRSAEPLKIEAGPGREGRLHPKESLPPGFRIAVWAFTHAPGLAPIGGIPEGRLRLAGPPALAEPASAGARLTEWPVAPPVSPALPAWRAQLVSEQPTRVAAEPPEAGYAALPAPGYQPGAAVFHGLPAAEMPEVKSCWPAGRALLRLAGARLRSVSSPCMASGARPSGGTADLRSEPGTVFAGGALLPKSRQLAALEFSAEGAAIPCPALAPRLREASAALPPAVEWQSSSPAAASFQTVRPSLRPVAWAPALEWRRPPLPAPGAGSTAAAPASVAVGRTRMAWPPAIRAAAPGTLPRGLPSPLPAPPVLDAAVARAPRPGIRELAAGPPAVALPAVTFGLPAVQLPAPSLVPEGGDAWDIMNAPRQASSLPAAPSSLSLPAGPRVPQCASDLFYPHPARMDPGPCDQAHALRDQSKLAPIGPSIVFQTHPMAPISHRFERLPHEAEFVLARRMVRSWKRIRRRTVLAVAAPALALLLLAVSWNPAREAARRRAAVTLHEDFSGGLGSWTSGAADWSRDPAGFAVVGSLALLGPSLHMTDYRLEFQGQIERESLAWVFRARDHNNYYAMKISVLQPGPLPTMALIRYRVLDAQQTPPVQVPLRILLHNESTFRVQMRVSGSDFTTFINQQQVDFWTDERFPSGGVGFFCDKGSRARLYWVRIAHQDDLLGKLCSFFAPNDLPRNGSWK